MLHACIIGQCESFTRASKGQLRVNGLLASRDISGDQIQTELLFLFTQTFNRLLLSFSNFVIVIINW